MLCLQANFIWRMLDIEIVMEKNCFYKIFLGGFLYVPLSLYMFFSFKFPHFVLFNFSHSKFKYVISNLLSSVPSQRLI